MPPERPYSGHLVTSSYHPLRPPYSPDNSRFPQRGRRSDRVPSLRSRGNYRPSQSARQYQHQCTLGRTPTPDKTRPMMEPMEIDDENTTALTQEMQTPRKQILTDPVSPPTLQGRHLDPPSTPDATPTKTPIKLHDIWQTRYLLEQRLLNSPPGTKPFAISFLSDDGQHVRESANTPRKITGAYSPEQIFGTASERKAELRPLEATFQQIWKRGALRRKWERFAMDHQGYLEIEEKEMKIQLQRHHVPGMFFIYTEGGSLNINDPTHVFPDVYYQLVDAPDQEFVRCRDNLYDLKREIKIHEGETVVSFEGIDGEAITVEFENGESEVTIKGKGMARDYEGSSRGDLVLNLVKTEKY